jgi:AraC-like DNA-binding protein
MGNRDKTVESIKVAPRPALRPFIQCFRIVMFPALHHDTHLPDLGPTAAFSLQGECYIAGKLRVPSAAFTGLHNTLRTHEHHHTVLLAAFTPVGAAAFLRPPQEELAGTTTDLAELLGQAKELSWLQEQLAEAPNHAQRIALLEDFLLAGLRDSTPDPLVSAAVTWLEQKTLAPRIDDLAQYIGLSQSALERRFRRVIGVSPKTFSSLIRFRRAVHLKSTGADFTAIAQAAGYFDQSHLIKDFHRVTGRVPEAFFREYLGG